MKNGPKIDSSSNQLRWVVLLLAGVVILPTVCLLWFMTQAVKNVQLAARQLLINECSQRVEEQIKYIDKIWEQRFSAVDGIDYVNSYEHFASILFDEAIADGFVIYNQSGNILHPLIESTLPTEPNLPPEFQIAWEQEFVKNDLTKAADIYLSISENNYDDYVRRKANLGTARCYRKTGLIEEASTHCEAAGYRDITPHMSANSVYLSANARIMLVQMNKDQMKFELALVNLIQTANNYEPNSPFFLPMDNSTRIFVQEKVIQFVDECPEEIAEKLTPQIVLTKKLLSAEKISVEVAQNNISDIYFRQWTDRNIYKLDVPGDIYGTYIQTGNNNLLLLWSGETIKRDFANFEEVFAGTDVLYQITNGKGIYTSNIDQPDSNAFLKFPISANMPGWQAELFVANNSVFEKKASREISVYIWAGTLVMVLILVAGGFAGQAVGKQIRLNRLKNDFIATISHELRTPLASMRVLADTLLEGNYKDQQQVTEYLQLICKENIRLSGLIDNFLTFSRMERNKQAFEYEKRNPADIANTAVEAVQAKFNKNICTFIVTIDKALPSILVDKDAIVTVLVNLLDNAYKYSYNDKKIELSVFSEDNYVCFVVRDNGIGITRRQIKKIFNRFYQADSSLTRRANGTGLGLSIVKFIIDAHKGKIEVQSQTEKGSTFTVKIPIHI